MLCESTKHRTNESSCHHYNNYYYKLRKSSCWSSSFIKCPAVFQIPAASNEQFVFQLLCQKFVGFNVQQFGRFSLNLLIKILFYAVFYSLKLNIQALVLPYIRILSDFSQATFQLFEVLTAFCCFISQSNNFRHSYKHSDWTKLGCFIRV